METKFVRLARGTAGQPLKVNSGGTDLDYGTLPVAGGGTGAVTLTGILKGSGTSAFTAVAAPTGAILGDSDVQNITGGKTFFDQTFKRRNPANTFTLTQRNPIITADADTYLNAPFRYHIFKVGSTYFAENGQTKGVEFSGATLDPVLTSVLAAVMGASPSVHFAGGGAGDILIDGGLHQLSGSFAGWTLPYALCTVKFSSSARIEVPNGYTGFVFKFITIPSPSVSAGQLVRVEGGYYTEAGTPAHNWTCFLFAPDSGNGIFNDSISDAHIAGAGIGLHLRVDHASGWGNGNVFDHLYMTGCTIGVLFDYNGQTPSLSNGFHRNSFMSLEGQAGANSTYGFKDIHGIMNMFWDCKMWDMQVGAAPNVTANITANANRTRIHGGIMTSLNFTDLGVATYYDDDVSGTVRKAVAVDNNPVETVGAVRMTGIGLQAAVISPSTAAVNSSLAFKQYNSTSFSLNMIPFSDAQTAAFSLYNASSNERLYFQKNGTTDYKLSLTKDASGGAIRDLVIQTQDLTTGPTTTEVMRILAAATVKFTGSTQDENFKDTKAISAPASPASGYVRMYTKAIDSNNDGQFYKAKINGAVVEVQY